MAQTLITGLDISNKSVTHLDIDLSGSPAKSPVVAADKIAIVDSANNLTSTATLTVLDTFLNMLYPKKASAETITGAWDLAQIGVKIITS